MSDLPANQPKSQEISAARAAAKLARQITIPLTKHELSLSQYRVLVFLDEGGAAPSDLAERLSVSRPSITALMDGLGERGLVERHSDPDDGRRVVHHLTDAGRRTVAVADRAVADRLTRLGAYVNAGDPTPLIENLSRFGDAIRAARAAGATLPVSPTRTTPRIHPDASRGWFRRLLPVVAARRATFAMVLVTGISGLALQVSVPMVLRRAVDRSLGELDGSAALNDLRWHVILLVVMATAAFALRFTYRYLLFSTACRIETDLRDAIYQHLTRLSFSFYDRVAAGEIISRANSDIRSIQLLLAFGPLAGLSIVSLLMALGFMLSIHVPLTLVTVSTMPLVFILAQKLRDRVFPLSWVTQGRMAEVAMVVDENVNGTRVVKSFAAEFDQIALLARAADRLRWAATALVEARARFNPVIEALPRLGMALVLLYGGHLAIDGQIGVGSLLAFSGYVTMIAMPFRMF
ncbi:MAG: ABC transporter transmembrane domain-containing protein, partial [Actinomycetota bacterium]|nr:ABC transporter transmembrane domain-containing protein [Actinomycetota bacterium]